MSEIMTLKDVADYLRINERTVAKLAQEGQIPGLKVASQWRFSKEAIDGWFAARTRHAAVREHEIPRPEISRLLRQDTIKMELSGRTREGVLAEMAGIVTATGVVTSGQKLLEALRERERLCSTGVGRGIALLHPRHVIADVVSETIMAFGRSSRGVDFNAVDGKPVHFFFLDCATSERLHLTVLARLSRLLADDEFLKLLANAKEAGEVITAVRKTEGRIVAS